ncbi:MAG: hypothetical protein JXR83_19210 [Deltaproteobacteria bacterium]|nr:hypothetical protein [Deltaproteobacteria bacterium]
MHFLASTGPVALLLLAPAAWATPYSTSPYITGMHDTPASDLLEGRGTCARGWVTELRYIGAGGTCPETYDFRSLADRGYGIILRLDYDGSCSLPPEAGLRDGYAATFASCVSRAQGVRVWIVGNEPNIAWGRVFSPDEVADIYHRVKSRVDALPAGANHQVLFPPAAPWASVAPWGDWDDGLAAAIDGVLARGGSLGGLALHPYTREFSVAAITSDAWFPGRENKWHLHFRMYRDYLALLSARSILDIPLYITETGNQCDPPCDPYPDQDIGYFVAMIEEVHAWNQAHPRQLIRAVTPYRWTRNDDGTGRDYCLGCSNPLINDLKRAADLGRKWDDSECNGAPSVDAGGGVDRAAPPLDAGCAVSACSVCVLEARPDILPFYQDNGWDIDCANWDAIVDNWCGIDSSGCAAVESGVCATECGALPPDAGGRDQGSTPPDSGAADRLASDRASAADRADASGDLRATTGCGCSGDRPVPVGTWAIGGLIATMLLAGRRWHR